MQPHRMHVAVLGWLFVFGVGRATVVEAQAEAMQPVKGAHGGQVARAADREIELLVDSLGLMQAWLRNTRSEPEQVPAGAKATLRGGGDNYSIRLRADSTGRRLVGRFDPHHFRIFEVEVSLPLDGKRRSVRFPYPRDLPFHPHH